MGFSWIIIGVVIVALLIFFKFKETQHRLHLWILAGFIIFILASIWTVYTTHSVDLTTFDGFVSLMKFYFLWLKQLGSNVVDATGYVIHQNWGSGFAGNFTNMTQ